MSQILKFSDCNLALLYMCSTDSDKSEQFQIVFIFSQKLLKLKIPGGLR